MWWTPLPRYQGDGDVVLGDSVDTITKLSGDQIGIVAKASVHSVCHFVDIRCFVLKDDNWNESEL